VIVSAAYGYEGGWILQVHSPDVTGTTATTSETWYTTEVFEQGESCYPYDYYIAPVGTYFWTQSTTGVYDIYVGFHNESVRQEDGWSDSFVALYGGNWVHDQSETPYAPCGPFNTSTYIDSYGSSSAGVVLQNMTLTAGHAYTLAFSGIDSTYVGYYGIYILPTQLGSISAPYTWGAPDQATGPSDCVAAIDTFYMFAYKTIVFQATGPYLLFEVAQSNAFITDTSITAWQYLYTGNNTANPPSSCANFITSDGDGPLELHLTTGLWYTAIISSEASQESGLYVSFLWNALQIGESLTITGGGAQTTTPLTTETNSGSFFTTHASSGGISTATTTTGHASAANSVSVSVLLVAVAMWVAVQAKQ